MEATLTGVAAMLSPSKGSARSWARSSADAHLQEGGADAAAGDRGAPIRTSARCHRSTCSAAGMTLSSTGRWTVTGGFVRPAAGAASRRPVEPLVWARMDSNGFGSKDNGSWRHATTFSSSPARSSVDRKRSSARSASGCGSAAASELRRLRPAVRRRRQGYVVEHCDGLLRLDATPPADADGWTEIEAPMSATAHRFAPGHHLASRCRRAHPRWARNTGTSEQIATATSLVPRPRPRVPGILLLCVNVLMTWIGVRKRTECQGRRLICMPLRTQSG